MNDRAESPNEAAGMRPATELPFRVINDPTGHEDPFYWAIAGGGGYFTPDRSGGFELTSHMRPEDARYIVHAANAYPKLVEALKDNAALWACPEDIALLRELGEIK